MPMSLFTLRASSLLSQLNNAFVDIVDDESFFNFLLKRNSHHPDNRYRSRITVLHTSAAAVRTCLNS